jgi:hypothetical protein
MTDDQILEAAEKIQSKRKKKERYEKLHEKVLDFLNTIDPENAVNTLVLRECNDLRIQTICKRTNHMSHVIFDFDADLGKELLSCLEYILTEKEDML